MSAMGAFVQRLARHELATALAEAKVSATGVDAMVGLAENTRPMHQLGCGMIVEHPEQRHELATRGSNLRMARHSVEDA